MTTFMRKLSVICATVLAVGLGAAGCTPVRPGLPEAAVHEFIDAGDFGSLWLVDCDPVQAAVESYECIGVFTDQDVLFDVRVVRDGVVSVEQGGVLRFSSWTWTGSKWQIDDAYTVAA